MNKVRLTVRISIVCCIVTIIALMAAKCLIAALCMIIPTAIVCCLDEKLQPDEEFDPFAEGAGKCMQDDLKRIKEMERSGI